MQGKFLCGTGVIFMASSTRRVSIDSWAVGLALLAALLVRFGIVKTVPW
jgi:hypothetical protein